MARVRLRHGHEQFLAAFHQLGQGRDREVLNAPDNQPIINTLEELKAALNSGNIKAQMDPNSKATVEITVKVEPSSNLINAAADAKAATSSGNIQATVGTSGSVGKSYPQTAPAGRTGGGGIGRM